MKSNIVKIAVLLSVLFSTVSCNYIRNQGQPEAETEVVEPELKNDTVIFLTNYFKDYLDSCDKELEPNKKALFRELVETPIYRRCVSDAEVQWVVKSMYADPIEDTRFLRDNLLGLKGLQDSIRSMVSNTMKEVREHIGAVPLKIYVVPANPRYSQMSREMSTSFAATPHFDRIFISIDPNIKGWSETLPYVMSHEYHHAYWMKHGIASNTWTMLDYLVFEGRADCFAHEMYPDIDCKWVSTPTDNELNSLWARIKGNLSSQDYVYQQQVMFGGGDYPNSGGYALGYRIVDSFLANNTQYSIEEWSRMDASSLYKASGFEEQ